MLPLVLFLPKVVPSKTFAPSFCCVKKLEEVPAPNSGIEAPLLPNVELPNADDVADVPKLDPVSGLLKMELSPKVGVTPKAETFEPSDFVASDFSIPVSVDFDPNAVDCVPNDALDCVPNVVG